MQTIDRRSVMTHETRTDETLTRAAVDQQKVLIGPSKLLHFRTFVFLHQEASIKVLFARKVARKCSHIDMRLSFVAALVILINGTYCGEVDEKFRSAKIVEDLLDKPPDSLLEVEFDCGFTTLGNKFAPLQVQNRPKVSWKDAKEEEFYTLVMTDVAEKRETVHWLVANIPSNEIDKGDVLTSYFPAAPPRGTGEHRFVFLFFRQPDRVDLHGQEKISTFQMAGRSNFSTKAFVEKFDMEKVPVAGNFFLAAWDESCNEMYKLVDNYEKRKN